MLGFVLIGSLQDRSTPNSSANVNRFATFAFVSRGCAVQKLLKCRRVEGRKVVDLDAECKLDPIKDREVVGLAVEDIARKLNREED